MKEYDIVGSAVSRLRRRHQAGQSTVEFALAFIFVALGIFGVIDVAHAVYEQHGLTRATEVIAHDLSVAPPGPFNASAIGAAVNDARSKSQIDFNTTATSNLTTGVMSGSDCVAGSSGTACQKLSNCTTIVDDQCTDPSANGMGWVDVIGIPSLCNADTSDALLDCKDLSQQNTDQVQVKITINNYGPHTTFFNSFPINTVSASSSSETNAYLQGN
jgi:Flp pilus assembly protein TadG